MRRSPLTLRPDMEIMNASQFLVDHHISGAPVVDEQELMVGILTERDCFKTTLSAGYYEELGGSVSEYMTRDVQSVDPDMSILDLAGLFVRAPFRRYPVVSEDRLIGLISRRDVLKALLTLSHSS